MILFSTFPPFRQKKDVFPFCKDLIWGAFLIVTVETDGKHGEREGVICNKGPWLELNQTLQLAPSTPKP